MVADPGEKIGVVGSIRGDAVSFRSASGVTSKNQANMNFPKQTKLMRAEFLQMQ